jgi:Uma2 family endonuclease
MHGEYIAPDIQDDVLLYIPKEAGRYEWIDGRIREVSEPQVDHSFVLPKMVARLAAYVDEHKLGLALAGGVLFLLQDEPRIVRGPDIAFVDKARGWPQAPGVWCIPPDLVIEIQSPSQSGKFMDRKSADYLNAGVRLVWVIEPRKRKAIRYRAGEAPLTLQESDVLNGEDVVPGFRCPVAEVLVPREWYSRG